MNATSFSVSLLVKLKPFLQTDKHRGLSLREIIHEYKHQTLVLFKCCLLQPKVAFAHWPII